jgi:hypothetical protein
MAEYGNACHLMTVCAKLLGEDCRAVYDAMVYRLGDVPSQRLNARWKAV